MKNEERKQLYAALAAPFPESCIQRTDGKLTGKGYSTSGIGYQFIVNRLKPSIGCWVLPRSPHDDHQGDHSQQRSARGWSVSATSPWKLGRSSTVSGSWSGESLADGSHQSSTEGDARKGAYTNAFKKAAAFFGVGKQAYEGTLDDDNVPSENPAQPQL